MNDFIASSEEMFAGLKELVDSAFPKRCATCGRTYQSAKDYFTQTEGLGNEKSGLKQSRDDDDAIIVEVYRNCICGSTLMDCFTDRRDDSVTGRKRRKKFGELMEFLVTEGMEKQVAQKELLKVLKGEGSTLLKNYRPPNM